MLGQNSKENHRIKYELVVEQINISCSDHKRTADINHICLQLYFTASAGKEEIRTECVSNCKRTSLTDLQYILTWKHLPVLKFSVTFPKRTDSEIYERAKRPPELFLVMLDCSGKTQKLGSTKLELHEHATRKAASQMYEEEDKLSLNLKSNKILSSCELLVRVRIPDMEPSVVEGDKSSQVSPAITPSVSIDTINSIDTRALSRKTLKRPIHKLLDEVHLIGVDGNLHSAEWSKMHLIFFVFGTMPDFMRNLRDLIQLLQEDRTIGLYVQVVHVCQGDLAPSDVLYPYLPCNDPKNSLFQDVFGVEKPYAEHPKICVVNRKLNEFFVVQAHQIDRFIEERNVLELYNLWNPKHAISLKPQRSVSLHDEIPNRVVSKYPITKSNSFANINTNHNRSSSYDGSSLPLSSSRSSLKGVKVTESQEYKCLEAELSVTKDSLEQLRIALHSMETRLDDQQKQAAALKGELFKYKILEKESQAVLEKCQKENIFFRHQVALRGNLSLRSGTFNLFKSRWFQLETLSSHSIAPVITFYNGPDKLGQIILAEIVNYELVTETQFRLSTRFAAYLINAETRDEARKWLAGIEVLQHTFNSEQISDEHIGHITEP